MATLRQRQFSVIVPILYMMELRCRVELPEEIIVFGSAAALTLMSPYYIPEIHIVVQ